MEKIPVTANEFNHHWKDYIPEGWGGLEIDNLDVIDFLHHLFKVLTLLPNFQCQQIKMKFQGARFYTTNTLGPLQGIIEKEIARLVHES